MEYETFTMELNGKEMEFAIEEEFSVEGKKYIVANTPIVIVHCRNTKSGATIVFTTTSSIVVTTSSGMARQCGSSLHCLNRLQC